MPTPQPKSDPDFIPYQPTGDTPDFIPADGGQAKAAPVDDRNGLQRAVDDAAAPDSPQVRMSRGPVSNALNDFGRGATEMTLKPLVHPLDTAMGVGNAIMHPYDTAKGMAKSVVSDFQDNGAAEAIPHLLGQVGGGIAASELGGKIAEPLAKPVSEGMKGMGGKIIDNTVGLTKKDVSHGAQPGRAYLEGGGMPSFSVRGIANKAQNIASDTGQKLGQKYDQATKMGITIPPERVASELNGPISKAMSIKTGPGGMADTSDLENYSASFRPMLKAGVEGRGITPNELFAAKKNVAANTTWNDPTQFNLNKVRQMNTGGMGKVLSENVSGTQPLNKIYQGTTNLAKRATARADSGQSSFSSLGRKGLETLAGGAMGMASHSPAMMALPLALDSVPVRTLMARGLFDAGRVIPSVAGPISRSVAPLPGVAGMAGTKLKPRDEK